MRRYHFAVSLLISLFSSSLLAATSTNTTLNTTASSTSNNSVSTTQNTASSTTNTATERTHINSALQQPIPRSPTQQAITSQPVNPTTTTSTSASTNVPNTSPATPLTSEMHFLMHDLQDPHPIALLDNSILISGLMNVDLSGWTHPFFTGSRNVYLDLNTANLNVDLQPTSWLSARASVLYANGDSPNVENYHEAYNTDHTAQLNEAYLALGNFADSPFFMAAGQQYLPFGDYYRFPMTESLTQLLSETNAPAIQAGFMEKGLYASAYGLNGATSADHSTTGGLTNFGADIGYSNMNNPVGYKVSVGYLNNMADIDSIYGYLRAENSSDYQNRVGGVSLNAHIYTGPFSFAARFVSALTHFNSLNYAYTSNYNDTRGAKPYAAGLNAGYQFLTFTHKSELNIGYQWSHEAYNTAPGTTNEDPTRLPLQRWIAGYNVYATAYVVLGLEVYRDQDYSQSHGGTGNYDNTALARISLFI